MAEVVAMDGSRTPDYTASPKNFRILYLMLTANPLTFGEWSSFDEDVYKFGLEASDGSSLYNFWEATGGRATVTMNGLLNSVKVIVRVPIKDIVVSGQGPDLVKVTVASQIGSTYTLIYSPDFQLWQSLSQMSGNGSDLVLTHSPGGADKIFYAVDKQTAQE